MDRTSIPAGDPEGPAGLDAGRPGRRWLRAGAYAAAGLLLAGGILAAYVGLYSWQLVRGVADDPERTEPEDVGVEPPRPVPAPDAPLNILVLGLDEGLQAGGRRGARRSDTVMLVSIDPLLDHRVSILSLPRDTRVTIPLDELDPEIRRRVWENPTKLGHAHAFGGPAAAMATVADFLGVEVHRYVRLAPDAFEALVDILGGVYVCVERDMYREDPYQDLLINLKRGCQWLDGRQAAGYARWREDGDIARIERQHKLIAALIDRALGVGVIPRLPQLVNEITSRVDTNLSEAEILSLVSVAMRLADDFDTGTLRTGTVPGTNRRIDGLAYWVADEVQTRRLVDRLVWNLEPRREPGPTVVVADGGAGAEAACSTAAYLRSLGYAAVAGAAVPTDRPSDVEPGAGYVLVYDASWQQDARVLARAAAEDALPVYAVSTTGRALAAAGDGGSPADGDLVLVLGDGRTRLLGPEPDPPGHGAGSGGDAIRNDGSVDRDDVDRRILDALTM
ncbi:MAG TPA: LCP family protein [Bacillota bacterium]